MRRNAFINERTLVSLEAIPDEYERGAQLMLKLLEEVHGTLGINVEVWMQAKVQREPVSPRGDTQRRDDGDFLITAAALSKQRRVAAQTPGSAHQRGHEHARFVDENEGGSQARGVFFTRGQSCSIVSVR